MGISVLCGFMNCVVFNLGCVNWYINQNVWVWMYKVVVVYLFDEVLEYFFSYEEVGDNVVFYWVNGSNIVWCMVQYLFCVMIYCSYVFW